MTTIGVLTERGSGRNDPLVLRRGLALVTFAVGAMSGGLLTLSVGVAAALSLGLGIIIAAAIAAHAVSRTSTSWSAPRSP